jgi:hypothetical protein
MNDLNQAEPQPLDQLQADLEARAAENAKTLPGWSTEKQAKFEKIILEEQAEYARRRKARDEADDIDMAVVVTPILEQSPPDPWQAILSDIESLPNTEGSLERLNGYVKVTSQFLLGNVLGISREKVHQNHAIRLSRVMECLGWEKPPNIWIGAKPAKGYRKSVE